MYHYTESGLSNVYLKNGFTVEEVDGESYSSIIGDALWCIGANHS